MRFTGLKKRIATTALAGAMALSLAAPAFASGNTTITGTYTPITLAVTVPATGKAIINPYGLPYKLDDETSISGQYITTGAPLLVQNKSVVPLSVSASVVGVQAGDFEFSATPVSDTETDKKANVIFQMFAADGVNADNVTDKTVLNQKFAALPADSDDSSKDIVVGTAASSANDIIVLKQGNEGELQDGGAAFFRLSGTVAQKPTQEWTTADSFSAKITFTFAPGTMTAVGGTIAAADTSLNAVTDSTTLTLTTTLPSGVTVDTWSWASSDTAAITVTAGTPTTTATANRVAAGSATITATGTGSDGVVYTATVDLTAS